ncbi:hypothetical protein DPMN_125647 [Dreissena polymorpha]|uniref:Uncharacterized protein n=1 Tax=Dreissena polymorpha TaxID=45954 RepID=A0A9D4GUS3_DREPO|nr:hypothetical protein DPMN_125647 [Dreissena polymorpha]
MSYATHLKNDLMSHATLLKNDFMSHATHLINDLISHILKCECHISIQQVEFAQLHHEHWNGGLSDIDVGTRAGF